MSIRNLAGYTEQKQRVVLVVISNNKNIGNYGQVKVHVL